MKYIPLTQGKFAIVDDEDYDWLMQWKWYARKCGRTYYALRNQGITEVESYAKRTSLQMHRIILKTPTGMDTDHINHNGLDNRKKNMRTCSHRCNIQNQVSSVGKSRYKGVVQRGNRWEAKIGHDGKTIHIGHYPTEKKAAKAYDVKAKELFGEFAHTNFKLRVAVAEAMEKIDK